MGGDYYRKMSCWCLVEKGWGLIWLEPCLPGPTLEVGLPAMEDDRLRFEVGVQPFGQPLTPGARLLEAAEGDGEIGAEDVVPHGARTGLFRP